MSINNYNQFIFENYLEEIENIPLIADAEILESIVVDSDELMSNVKASKETFEGDPLNFDIKSYPNDYRLEQLRNNSDFNKILDNNNLFISELSSTQDYDTFILDDIKYMLIHERADKKMNKLEKLGDPIYVIFQTKDMNGNWTRDNIKIYRIEGNFNNFYKKLTSKTIEIRKDGVQYIYGSNGKNWILKNIQNKGDIFRDIMTNDDIKLILKDKGVTITIVS
jgi:hypothetical protein